MSTKVLVNGANGKMGQAAAAAVDADPDLELVGRSDEENDLGEAISSFKPDVVVDFTVPSVVYLNLSTIVEANVCPVIGTTGLLPEQIREMQTFCAEQKLGGVIAPNFAITTVLMMKYAEDAARYLGTAEVIELHHDKKLDAPSGTALKTAEMISNAQAGVESDPLPNESSKEARGEDHGGVRVHSVRLPGLIAHQEVLFGSTDQLLTIRSDSFTRESFMPGVCLACKKVPKLNELYYGLEHLLT